MAVQNRTTHLELATEKPNGLTLNGEQLEELHAALGEAHSITDVLYQLAATGDMENAEGAITWCLDIANKRLVRVAELVGA